MSFKFYLFAVAFHKPGLFEVDLMAWDAMRAGLEHNRTQFVTEISGKYDCVVAFSEIALDLE